MVELNFENFYPDQSISLILVVIATLLVVYLFTSRPRFIPPGPLCWPVIGNLGSVAGKDTMQCFRDLRARYGDIYGLYMGSELTVFINSYDLIHEAFVKHGTAFANRPDNIQFIRLNASDELSLQNGQIWKERRGFVMKAFNNLCFVQNGAVIENVINDELRFLTNKLDNIDNPLDPSSLLPLSFANVIHRILFGKRAGDDLLPYMDWCRREFKVFTKKITLAYCFPFLSHAPGDPLRLKEVETDRSQIMKMFNKTINEIANTFKEDDQTCIVDFLLKLNSPFAKENIWKVVHELMAAGNETSATIINWFILLIAKYPSVQNKLKEEIRSVIGTRNPNLSDRANLPYVQATIMEAMRISNVAPLGFPRYVKRDVEFRGYTIPKNTTVHAVFESVLHDPLEFPDPMEFKPERFLSDDGSQYIPSEKVIVFSIGQRSCLGETIARIELFLYVVTLVQRYEFVSPAGHSLPSLKGVLGLTYKPQEYTINIVKRLDNDVGDAL